jgi:hypothetical protein
MRRIQLLITLLAVTAAGCGGSGGSVACGLAAMSGPLIALEGFARGDGIAVAPANLPPSLPARYVAGTVTTALVSRTDSLQLIAAVDAAPPNSRVPATACCSSIARSTRSAS